SEAANPDVFVETENRELQCRRLTNGQIRWTVPAFGPDEYKINQNPLSATIAVTEHVVLHAVQKRVNAYDRGSGALLWSQRLEQGGSRTPLVNKEHFFIAGVPALFDLSTGKTVWKSDENVKEASFLPNGDLMVALYDGLACLARLVGRVLWKTKIAAG